MEENCGPGETTNLSQVTNTLSQDVVHIDLIKIRTQISVAIGTDSIVSCKSNYHTITSPMAPPKVQMSVQQSVNREKAINLKDRFLNILCFIRLTKNVKENCK